MNQNLNKQDVVNSLYDRTEGITKTALAKVLDATLDVVRDTLAAGDRIAIPKFGNFELHDIAQRAARNPKTGEIVQVAAYKRPVFKASCQLRKAVN